MLTRIPGEAVAPFRTPVSGDTSSDEVFKLALTWITTCDTTCQCAKKTPTWYPTRLIDIRALKSELFLNTRREQYTGNKSSGSETLEKLDDVTVKLVEKPSGCREHPGVDVFGANPAHKQGQPNNLYVTLSHRWGSSLHYTLDPSTDAELRAGIKLERLPKTFRDAIKFASQLHNVGWIWIDALCIIQSGKDSKADWLHEAGLMQKVYRESYLNISATAASDSDMGLYFPRDHMALWEDEVNLNIEGLPGLRLANKGQRTNLNCRCHTVGKLLTNRLIKAFCWWAKWCLQRIFSLSNNAVQQNPSKTATAQIDWGGDKPVTLSLPEPKGVRRCVLTDAANWDDLVNEAPVNKRAWVLQERLLAPRVLHFCNGRIAWECRHFTRAEGHPTGLRKFRVEGGRILPEVPIKGLDPATHGSELRKIRLRGSPEPDMHLVSSGSEGAGDLCAFELWARVVETYSRLSLTNGTDKLIALAGIAELVSTQVLGTEARPAMYVAGLWKRHLESQLLWKVEPVFRRKDRTFLHPSRRPRDDLSSGRGYSYRAPSFSWASVDAEEGNGIVYGEVTDRDLLIELYEGEDSVVIEKASENAFGLVTRGHILIWGRLRKITLSKEENGRFSWRLVDRNLDLDKEAHKNVYLDSPEEDDTLHGIFDSDNIYCVPAAYGERTEAEGSKYMICLLLQLAEDDRDLPADWDETDRHGTYRRIGLTKLSTWADKETYERILDTLDSDLELPRVHKAHDYRGNTGQHLIRII